MTKKIIIIFAVFVSLLLFLNEFAYPEEKGNFKKTSEDKLLIKVKTKPYKWEFSTALALGFKFEPWIKDSKVTLTIGVPARIGYFIGNNIEIEPEINLMYDFYEFSSSKIKPLYLVNLSHNFFISSKLIAFTLGGIGFLSIKEKIGVFSSRSYRMAHYFVWSVGAGIKWFQSKKVALRFECRYMNVKEDPTYVISYLRIFMGISIFLINNSN